MRVAMLGPFRLMRSDGGVIEVSGPRVRMLLARLALEGGGTVGTDRLIDDLWGADPPNGAVNALQSLVSRARRLLPSPAALRSDSTGYVLAVAPGDVDVHRFERLAADGRRRLAQAEYAEAATQLRAALSLWRGAALIDIAEAPFAVPSVAHLDELRTLALEDRIDADLRLGRAAELVAELDGLRVRHPLRERLAALHIRALRGAGRQAEALATYDALRRRLADELGVDPSPELRELHLTMLRGGSPDPGTRNPAETGTAGETGQREPPAPAPAKSTAPTRMSSFVGRESEVRHVATALARSRLVTLSGPGGAGKTRLATESIAEEGNAWFVELAASGGGHELLSTVLVAVASREGRPLDTQPTDALSRLVETFSPEPALLVLDNCEHVIVDAAALVQDLLSRCPRLRVLATSREPLGVSGEELLPVGPLTLPDGDRTREAAAVRLFVDRAAAVRPGFVLDEHNIGEVAEICRRLDGLPLAIELAAARLRAFSLRQVADRLDDRFRLLANGNRPALARHRTLRAVVEWSWDLFSAPEQVLARRMSVFAGTAGVESIAAVCADDAEEVDDAVYVLASLVEKSFVETVEADGVMRYRMLETVRAYCAERLDEAGEAEAIRTAHAAHFLEFAERVCPLLLTSAQMRWLCALDVEHENIMTALRWCKTSEDAERAVRLCAAMIWYWAMSSQAEELLMRCEDVVSLPGAPPLAHAAVELSCSMLPIERYSRERVRAALAEARATDAVAHYAYLAFIEPISWWLLGEEDEARRSVSRVLDHPDPWARAAGLFGRAFLAEHSGDPAGGEQDMRAAESAFRATGDRWGIAQTVGSLAEYRSLRGDHAGAIEILAQSVESIQELRSIQDLVPLRVRIGLERLNAGDVAGAAEEMDEAVALAGTDTMMRASALYGMGELARRTGDHDRARSCFAEHRKLLEQATPAPGFGQHIVLLPEAQLSLDEHRFDSARELLVEALPSGADPHDMPGLAGVAEQTARLCHAGGDPREAARLLGMAAGLRGAFHEREPDIRSLRDTLRDALNPDEYQKAFDVGAELHRDVVLAELRRVLGFREAPPAPDAGGARDVP